MKILIAVLVAGLLLLGMGVGFALNPAKAKTVRVPTPIGRETLYIRNLAPQYISDKLIENDIPAWQRAVNVDFARFWHSTQFQLVFIGRRSAPAGAMSAVFVRKGPVQGALAYHDTERGNAPDITVYAGTGDYFGYDNSVSFTHELEELAADPVVSFVNQGYPSDYFYLQKSNGDIEQHYSSALGWFNEVSDPVEEDSYVRPGFDGRPVRISDFVTPAWFNDPVGGRYDFMGLCQQPFWIRPGGYAQFLSADGWALVSNFRSSHPADRGFLKGDPDEGSR